MNYPFKKVDISGYPTHVTFPVAHIDGTGSPEGGLSVTPPELNCNKVK